MRRGLGTEGCSEVSAGRFRGDCSTDDRFRGDDRTVLNGLAAALLAGEANLTGLLAGLKPVVRRDRRANGGRR